MNKSSKWSAAAGGAAVSAALALPGSVAYANTNPPPLNAGDTSVAYGNQAQLSLNLPVDVCGLAIALLGSADAGCQGGATVGNPPPGVPANPGAPANPGFPGNPGGPNIPPSNKPLGHETKPPKPPKHHVPPKHHKPTGGSHCGSAGGSANGGSANGGSSSTQTTSGR